MEYLQIYTFVRTVTEIHSTVRLKILFWVLQTALYVSKRKIRTKWLSFEFFNFKFFSRIWAENIQQCYQKPNSTRREGRLKNEVLVRRSLIPKNVFAIWRKNFGFSLKHFSMVGDTGFCAFKEWIQQEIFRDNFCFSLVTGLWVKRFLIFSRIFSRRCQ